jgi:hypothetical protein
MPHSSSAFFQCTGAPDQYPPHAQSPAVPATEQGFMHPPPYVLLQLYVLNVSFLL